MQDDGFIWLQGTRYKKTTCSIYVLVFFGIIVALILVFWISAQF